ncbi:hypothetical protein [Candidatus Palauibacter sp.]|uniref:hypothetical protein n=1 Tax=Candidatus Palauibacter sp. TaxID=3101350 RepID=UPI003B0290E8
MSHGRAEVGADLIARMAKQCRLSKDEFLRLVDCPMTGSEYVEMLKSRGHLMR